MSLRKYILRENAVIFFFSLALIAGPCLSVLFTYDLSQFHDCKTYLGLAELDFDQSPVRRYRLLVPLAAALLDATGGRFFDSLAPTYFTGDFSLPFSFFIVNLLLMSWFGTLVYRYCRAHQLSPVASLLGLLVVLSSRYTYYFASLPLIDSLFCVVVGITLLGIKTKDTGLLVCAIFLGPFARESFIFVAPVIFFCSHIIPRTRQLILFLLSAALVFSYRYFYDILAPVQDVGWIEADLGHLPNLYRYLPLLFSFYGMYKIAVSLGAWWLLPCAALVYFPAVKPRMKAIFRNYVILFLLLVLLQMLLSGSMERMFYLAMPVMAVVCAAAGEEFRTHFRKSALPGSGR